MAAAGVELSLERIQEETGRPVAPAPAVQAVLERLRRDVEPMRADRFLAPDLEAVRALVAAGGLVRAAGMPFVGIADG